MLDRMNNHRRIFGGNDKPVIGCLHLKALPGTPMWDREMSLEEHVEKVIDDAKILKEAGFDAFVFANEADYPYVGEVGPEIVAAYTRIVCAVMHEFPGMPFGIGVMFDPMATVAVAKATGAKFMRGAYHGTTASDFGLLDRKIGEQMRYAKSIGADDIGMYSMIHGSHFGDILDKRSYEDRYRSAKSILPVTGFIIGKPNVGTDIDEWPITKMKVIDPSVPLIINNGMNPKNIGTYLPHCDGVIVGTALKRDGYLFNEIDRDRAMEFMDAVRAVR